MEESLREGAFAKKQIFCRAGLIAWSHRRRFQMAVSLARPLAGRRLLDYGCGDGTFLAMLMAGPHRPAVAVGAERDERLVADCRQRLGQQPGLGFVDITELDAPEQAAVYDGLFCMEVLEHVVEVDAVLEQFARWLAPGGRLFISVPVEIGLSLLVKQTARRLAGWRGLGDYPGTSPYTVGELGRSLFPGTRQAIPRPLHRHADGSAFHDHKGFNWRNLRAQVARRFRVEATCASPLRWLTPLASQVWLLARQPD